MSHMKNTGFRFAASALTIAAALALPVAPAYADLGGGSSPAVASASLTSAAAPMSLPAVPPADQVFPVEPSVSAPSADVAPADAPQAETSPASEVELHELAEEALEAAPTTPAALEDSLSDLDDVLADSSADPLAGVEDDSIATQAGPDRTEVEAAIATVLPAIRACAPGQNGRLVSVVQVFDASGRTRSATVRTNTAHVDANQRSCMARAARDANVPAFEGDSFQVSFPVQL